MTYWELFPFSAWANNYKLLEVNHSIVVSSLITCLIWGIMSNEDIFMNEELKLAKNNLFLLHTKETHSLGEKNRKKNVPGIVQHNSRTLIFSSYHEGQQTTGMFKKKH